MAYERMGSAIEALDNLLQGKRLQSGCGCRMYLNEDGEFIHESCGGAPTETGFVTKPVLDDYSMYYVVDEWGEATEGDADEETPDPYELMNYAQANYWMQMQISEGNPIMVSYCRGSWKPPFYYAIEEGDNVGDYQWRRVLPSGSFGPVYQFVRGFLSEY